MEFALGVLVMTRAIDAVCKENAQFSAEVDSAFKRYIQYDWGEMGSADLEANDKAVIVGDDRIFASYVTSMGEIWIITEWDRSCTTILFPSDY